MPFIPINLKRMNFNMIKTKCVHWREYVIRSKFKYLSLNDYLWIIVVNITLGWTIVASSL